MNRLLITLLITATQLSFLGVLHADDERTESLTFERIVIDSDFPGGYQVEVIDINGDGKKDIVGLGGGTCAWFENPTWTKRIITTPETTPGIISSASHDLDGDGCAEVAIAYQFAMREPSRGKLGIALQGKTVDDPWTFQPLQEVPSIHRIRWGRIDEDATPSLVVVPIFGPDATPDLFADDLAKVIVLKPDQTRLARPWPGFEVTQAPVIHAVRLSDLNGDGLDDILTASNRGIVRTRELEIETAETGILQDWNDEVLSAGVSGDPPNRGASEIHIGHFKDGRRFLASIEPWHGNQVVITPEEEPGALTFGPRLMIDKTLDQGHALWVADVDLDGTDEVFAGCRGTPQKVVAYHYDGSTWQTIIIDTEIAAQDLRGGDLDGDGVPDVIAIGGTTQNIVWYRPHR